MGATSVQPGSADALHDSDESRVARIAHACNIGDVQAATVQLALLARDAALQGHATSIAAALAVVPENAVLDSAQACYWLGQAALRDDEVAARTWFMRALAAAQRAGDLSVARSATAAAVVCYLLSFDGRADMKRAFEAFDTLVSGRPGPDVQERSLLTVARLCISYESRAFSLSKDEIEDAFAQVMLDLPQPERWASPALQLACAVAMIDYAGAFLNVERARDVALATGALVARPTVGPRLRALWWIERSWLYANDSDGPVFHDCLANIDALAEQLHNDSLRFQALRVRCAAALRSGRVAEAVALLPSFERLMALSEHECTEHSRLKAAVLLMAGRAPEALDLTEAALRLARARAADTGGSVLLLEMEHVHALAAAGRPGEAALLSFAQAEREYGASRDHMLARANAYAWQASGERDEAALRAALDCASRASLYQLLPRDPAVLARLCDAALRRGIEPRFVSELIERRRLTPPPFAGENWPWAARVETLGGFRLYLRGQPYRPEHKAQDKVLELLKLLVAARILRRGDAERDWLCEQLWPDADAPRARKSLETSVARLRRLLQDDAAVVVSEGRVSLETTRVWSDVGAFAEAWARIKAAQDALLQQRPPPADGVLGDVSGLLAMYNGPFLQGDAEAAWIIGTRAQLSRLLRQALLAYQQIEGRAHPGEFLLLLERAHAADPGAEEIAQMLMRHHLEQANHAEALRVYRRTRDTIQAVLGTPPSPQTEMLGQEVFRAAERDAAATSRAQH